MLKRVIEQSMDSPKATLAVICLLTILFATQFIKIHIDTDPENMLSADQPDRVLYDGIKKNFTIHDLIVFGLTDEAGAFRPATLEKVSRIIDGILLIPGVITDDVVSLTTTNDVTIKEGQLEVRRIMREVPETLAASEALSGTIADNPLLADKLISADGTGIAVYVPIVAKDQARRIGSEISSLAGRELTEGQKFYLAGLPIAEDSFGIEMFIQMGIMSPISGMMIFLLLWLLFRKMTLILPVMAVAMCTVILGMGLLIGLGFTVHIMSSMIPVFLMPIAVLDSVHILSDFYDRYPGIGDRRETLRQTMDALYTPMLFTSLTSSIGFASLLLAPIPPVQVFGAFVAIGILMAWLLTITFIPASIMLISEDELQVELGKRRGDGSGMNGKLQQLGQFAFNRAAPVSILAVLVLAVGFWGISRTVVNDNPVNWFAKDHELRIADRVMNKLFGGTYMAYLVLEGKADDDMKRPEVLEYMVNLQRVLDTDPAVGKTSSLADIIGQVGYVLHDKDVRWRKVPDNQEELAQYMLLYQLSGNVGDLDKFVDYDYRSANIWVQMKQGDNRIMARVQHRLLEFTRANPPPGDISLRWSGLTYINKVWQDLMVGGMLKAIVGGFIAVLVLMVILFRSVGLGLLSMLPLTFAITMSYGLAGFAGKDYDMPIAVVSSLALGLSIDFAIHFVQRYRACLIETGGDLERANQMVFGETTRAILRNALVIAIGFLPMVFSPLGPYRTVGVFFALLMIFSSLTTLCLLPGLLRLTHGHLWTVGNGVISTSGDN
ncbi:MAG: RND transporter [Gammaproteobacteria bacterium]|nr:RND transporter [Gammaproteobacteria bacterium]